MLLLAACTTAVTAQQEKIPYSPEAEKEFRAALKEFTQGEWRSAAREFRQLAQEVPLHQRTTASYVMAGRALLRSGESTRCLRLLEEFRKRFPSSSYLAESYFISAEASSAAQSPGRALECYIRARVAGFDDPDLLKRRIAEIDPASLSPYDLRVATNLLKQLYSEERVGMLPGEQSERKGENGSASDGLHSSAIPKGESRDAKDGQSVTRGGLPQGEGVGAEETARKPVIIAAALPLHLKEDARKALVEDMVTGVRAALDQHEEDDGYPVKLVLFDSMNRDSVTAMIERLERNPRAVVLLAGAFSEDARIVCEAAGERDLLVLIPTATAEGLTRYGSNIFQLNTPIVDRAELLADFCYLELDARQVVILTPQDSYPRKMAEAFRHRWEEIGLPFDAIPYATGDASALKTACRSLAARGAKTCILFAPVASKQDIASVLKGVGSTGIKGTIVGGGNWNHPDLLRKHAGRQTIYYETDVLPDSSRTELHRLRRELPTLHRHRITREMLFGFDAMELALKLVGDGPITRREARNRIRNVFEGVRAPINFMQTRVNRAMNILKCVRGGVTQMESFYAK